MNSLNASEQDLNPVKQEQMRWLNHCAKMLLVLFLLFMIIHIFALKYNVFQENLGNKLNNSEPKA